MTDGARRVGRWRLCGKAGEAAARLREAAAPRLQVNSSASRATRFLPWHRTMAERAELSPAWAWSVHAQDGFPKFHEIFGNFTRSARFSLCEIIFVLGRQLKIHDNG